MNLDLTEDDKAILIEAEIPGARKEDIRIELDGDRLTLRVQVKLNRPEGKCERIVCCERSFGRLSRSVTLPGAVDERLATMEYRDGILSLTLPKKSTPRRAVA